jgi:hypothetical protein
VDYDCFVLEPVEQFRALMAWLNASDGAFTAKILAGVSPQKGPGVPAPADAADARLMARAKQIHATWREAAARQYAR